MLAVKKKRKIFLGSSLTSLSLVALPLVTLGDSRHENVINTLESSHPSYVELSAWQTELDRMLAMFIIVDNIEYCRQQKNVQ